MAPIQFLFFTEPRRVPDPDFEEDTTCSKLIACIPWIGIFPSLWKEHAIQKKISDPVVGNVPKLIRLIDLKNQYKIANVTRDILSTTLLVTGVASGCIASTLVGKAIVFASVHIGTAGIHAYKIYHNNQSISLLQTRGLRPEYEISIL